METIGRNQQRSFHLGTFTVAALQQSRHSLSVRAIAIARDFQARADGICAQAFHSSAIEEYLQLAPVHGILRPLVAGPESPEFGIDFIAIQTDQCPFSGLQSDRIERFRSE